MGGSVLIVDDSAADRALLRTILGRAGYTDPRGRPGRRTPSARPAGSGRISSSSTSICRT